MQIKNRITELFNIKYPIVLGGMVWVSGWKLAKAVSNCGGLGLIGAGSMKAELLAQHIDKFRKNSTKPFGVNIPLLRKDSDDLINLIIEKNVEIVFTSAGNPAKYTDLLKKHRIKVVHVVSSVKQAKKAESVGCDAVVGEGVEAGGHNGIDELTTFTLITLLKNNLSIPIIAAGGIAHGSQIAASFVLGAEGIQIGTLFAAAIESSAHSNYKQAIINSGENDTTLAFRKIGLVRMIKNNLTARISEAEAKGATNQELLNILGEKREMRGIFEGDLNEGMLEAGQSAALVNCIDSVKTIFERLLTEYNASIDELKRG